MNQEIFTSTIKALSYAMPKNDVRHYLNGICLEIEREHITMIATNGHFLMRAVINHSVDWESLTGYGEFIIPNGDIKQLLKLFNIGVDLELVQGETIDQLVIKTDKLAYTVNRLDGKYPNWRQVLNQSRSTPKTRLEVGCNLECMEAICKALKPLCVNNFKGGVFTISDPSEPIGIKPSLSEFHSEHIEQFDCVLMPMRI